MKRRVLIIGGGLTGLTAAYRLQASGQVDVVLVEKSPSLGGLADDFKFHGHPLERAYHHLFRTDTDILSLVSELGLESELEWHESSLSIHHGGRFHPFSGPRDLLRFAPLSFLDRLRVGAVVFFLQRYRKGTQLASASAYHWMRRWSGAAAMKVIWEPLLRGKFSSFAERISMAWLWARIHIRANSREGGGPEKLGYFKNGFGCVTRALMQRFTVQGGSLNVGMSVTSLERSSSGWKASVEGQASQFDAVLYTGSCPSFARFLEQFSVGATSDYLASLRAIPYLSASCLIFSYPESLTDAYWNNINDDGAPFLVLINHTKLVPRERYAGHHVYYIGAYHAQTEPGQTYLDEARVSHWFDFLEKITPGFQRQRIIEQKSFHFRDAQHCVEPGYVSRIPAAQTPLPGLFLSNFAQIYPEDRGTNYAVRDGIAAAARIKAFLGLAS